MTRAYRWIPVVAVVLTGLALARAQERPGADQAPPGAKALRDLEYARPDRKPLLLDLYLPEDADRPLPLVIWIHGGAWLGGSKERTPALPLLPKGYAVASIDYRLSQVAKFPAQIEDCKAAVRWLRAHAKEYHLDPDRFGVWGSSAGGHLVALLGTSGGVKELEGDEGSREYSSRVQAVCDWFGPTDFLRMIGMPSQIDRASPDCPEALLIGGPLQQNKEKADRANPITYITKDDPPFLIMHGDQDMTVPFNQSELLYDALKKTGVEVTLVTVKGAGHGFGGPQVQAWVEAFFDRQLKRDSTAWKRLTADREKAGRFEVEPAAAVQP